MLKLLHAVLDTTRRRTPISQPTAFATWSTAVGLFAVVLGLTLQPVLIPIAAAQPAGQSRPPEPAPAATHNHRAKILYIEGEVRPEFAFLRRALDQDENLQLVTLIRTAKDRFMRQGIDDSLELAAGFPAARAELFKYRAIVLGSIEAGFFSSDQLKLIADFVQRGGGLLMLGGRKSFAEGGYAKTVLADVLPVELAQGNGPPGFRQVKVELTPAGARHSAMQIAASDSVSVKRWKRLPEVSNVNRIVGAKPGADVFLSGTPIGARNPGRLVVLAAKRYGQGTALAFTIQDSWVWRVRMNIDDTTHQTFWRQILRSLSTTGPTP